MEQRLTHQGTMELPGVLEIGGDMLLLPEPPPLREVLRALQNANIAGLEPGESGAMWYLLDRQTKHGDYWNQHRVHPTWLAELPVSAQRYILYEWAITKQDQLSNVMALPYSGISYVVLNGGLCEAACDTFNVWRLSKIRQLGFLQAPTYNAMMRREPLSLSDRFTHSLDVMAVMTVMLQNLPFTRSYENTARVLGLAHDAKTPAGGDSVKPIDPVGLDEERNLLEALPSTDMEKLRSYAVHRDEIAKGMRNEGPLGLLLDIADKIAYTGRDLHACLHHIEAGSWRGDQPALETLVELIQRHPYACGVWDSVAITSDSRGQIYFNDILRLVTFLKVRLLLFREVYLHPVTRFREFAVEHLLARVLYRKGKLTREKLLTMTDADLERLLDKEYGFSKWAEGRESDLSRCRSFNDIADAQDLVEKLRRDGHLFVMLDDTRRSIVPGTHFPVMIDGKVSSLREADPMSARELDEMSKLPPHVHVYWMDENPKLPRGKLEELTALLAT